MNDTVYVITGPTAVGKSDVAIELARRIDGEIVNADSVQLYKYMDIGSAKPKPEQMQKVPHHLFSIVEPDFYMTAAVYQRYAIDAIDEILARGKTPIVVGGTGLYINAVMYKMDWGGTPEDNIRRRELEETAERLGSNYMYNYLSVLDPETAKRIHPNNTRKVIRAIETYELGDGIKSMDDCVLNDKYNFRFFALTMPRDILYDRINKRVDSLFKKGLVGEVKTLMDMGYDDKTSSMKGIGYKEIIRQKTGLTDKSQAELIDEIKQATRHYAKRQMTWINRYDDSILHKLEISPDEKEETIVERILAEEFTPKSKRKTIWDV